MPPRTPTPDWASELGLAPCMRGHQLLRDYKNYKKISLYVHPDKCRNAPLHVQHRLLEVQQELNQAHERAEEAKDVFCVVNAPMKKGPLTRAILDTGMIEGKGEEEKVRDDFIRDELLRALTSCRISLEHKTRRSHCRWRHCPRRPPPKAATRGRLCNIIFHATDSYDVCSRGMA